MASSHSIAVSVRVRPLRHSDAQSAVSISGEGITVTSSGERGKLFQDFACVVTGSDQSIAYNTIVGPLLEQLRSGYSCTLLAYGQTGSGKTHTVFGPPGCITEASIVQAAGAVPADWGIFPRVVFEIMRSGLGTLHASAVEIYHEKVYDLLAGRAPLTVGTKSAGRQVGDGPLGLQNARNMADGHAGVHPSTCTCLKCFKAKEAEKAAREKAKQEGLPKPVRIPRSARASMTSSSSSVEGTSLGPSLPEFATVGETLQLLESPADVAQLTLLIEGSRTAVGHALNARSSRSHCLVHLHVSHRSGTSIVKRQLLFVDLAGSERILKTGVEGAARAQATAINGSLTALGKVIRALGTKTEHVPYRDSTLTMMLRSSLGGRAYTSVVINIAPDVEHAEESICSLEFGKRMSIVRNSATVVIGQDLKSEIDALRAQLALVRATVVKMEADGQGESFGAQAAAGEIRSFKDNVKRQDKEEAAARAARAELAELKASGNASDDALAAVAARIQAAELEANNYKMIVLRQKSIKGFYFPAKAGYTLKCAELRQLESKLAQLEASL